MLVNGRAVNQPASVLLRTNASWASEVWFRVKGKDYCPRHHTGMAEDAPDTLVAERAAAERAAGYGEVPLSLLSESEYDDCAAMAGLADSDAPEPVRAAPSPSPAPARPSFLSQTPSLGTLAIIALLLMAVAYLWQRMGLDEWRLALLNRSGFEDRGSIRFLGFKSEGNTLRCSGEIIKPDQSRVPVRYSCDREQCWFEK